MLYRLLRNNKESGPFTALQLKEMGLKPYDLLWTEGRGAAWQYASEITELKDFAPVVEEQPFERLYKRNEPLETDTQSSVAVKKVKPRYRISNGQLIMVEAGNMEVGTNGVIKETAPVLRAAIASPVESKPAEAPDWQTAYPQWQPQQPKKEVKDDEPLQIETKYSESLDDLKKRYAEKVLGDKKESFSSSLSSGSAKQNIMAIFALVVLVAGGYIGYTLKKKGTTVTNGQAAIEKADIASSNANETPLADNGVISDKNNSIQTSVQANTDKNEVTNDANIATLNSGKSAAAAIAKENNSKPTEVVLQKKSADEITGKANTTGANKVAAKSVVTINKPVVKTGNNSASKTPVVTEKNNTVSTSALPAPPVTKPAGKQIGDYVSVKKLGGSGAGVQNVKLMVSNVSDFPIDLAVVDIQYFDSKGKYQKGETMYVKDINGGNNVEVRVPDSDKSSSIKYKVSMVQADQKTLYMVAD